MLSPSCDFEEFFEAVRGKRYLDVVYHAELEATEVERLSYRHKAAAEKDNKGCRKYADTLKELIFFLRYTVKPYRVKGEQASIFRMIQRELAQNKTVLCRPQ